VLTTFIVDSTPFSGNLQKVNPQTNIGLVFNKNISFTSTGTITIYNSSGAVHQSINVNTNFNANKTNELIWISGNTLWINPTKDMPTDQTYYVLATPTCVQSFQADLWEGLSNQNTVRFTVDPGPTATTTPISNDNDKIIMVFDREIEPGTGALTYSANGVNVGTTSATDDSVDITTA
jgi:hypothetical protein